MKFSLVKIIILAAIAQLLFACQAQQEAESKHIDNIRAVKIFTVLDTLSATERSFPGKAASSTISILSFAVSGTLSELLINIGDQIEKGQRLAALDNSSFILELQVTQAEYMKAKAQYDEKNKDYDRKRLLAEKGWISRNEVDQAESAMKSSLQQMNLSATRINLSKKKVADTVIIAPYSGIITERSIDEYQEVSAGQNIVTMEGLESINIIIDIPEKLVAKLSIGQAARVTFNAFDQVFSARIVEIGSAADIANTFRVKLSLLARSPQIKSGMSASVSLNIDQKTDIAHYLIPLTSVIAGDSSAQAYVYIFNPDTLSLSKKAVMSSQKLSLNNFIAVTGLNAGDQIVSAGVSFLSEGLTVKRYQQQ